MITSKLLLFKVTYLYFKINDKWLVIFKKRSKSKAQETAWYNLLICYNCCVVSIIIMWLIKDFCAVAVADTSCIFGSFCKVTKSTLFCQLRLMLQFKALFLKSFSSESSRLRALRICDDFRVRIVWWISVFLWGSVCVCRPALSYNYLFRMKPCLRNEICSAISSMNIELKLIDERTTRWILQFLSCQSLQQFSTTRLESESQDSNRAETWRLYHFLSHLNTLARNEESIVITIIINENKEQY